MGKQTRGMSTARKTKQTRQSSHPSVFWNCRSRNSSDLWGKWDKTDPTGRKTVHLSGISNVKSSKKLKKLFTINGNDFVVTFNEPVKNLWIDKRTKWFTERLHGGKSSVILTPPFWVLLILTRHMAWCLKQLRKKFSARLSEKKCWGQLAFKLFGRQKNCSHRKTPWREIECYFNPSFLGAPYIDEAHGMVFKATKKKIQCSTFRNKCWGQLAFKSLVARKSILVAKIIEDVC